MPAWQAQYGPWPGSFLAPQKRKSDWAGSPIGQRHIDSRNSTMVTGSDIGTTTSLTVWESIYKCTAYLSAEALADGVTKNAHWAALGWRPARRFTQIVFVPALDGLS